jgi:endonuclease YncB( thermonuclease family)
MQNPSRIALVALGAFLLLPVARAWDRKAGSTVQATVSTVYDGDTIHATIEGEKVKVRLACIDAPEMKLQEYAEDSKRALDKHIPAGTAIELRITQARDAYGRLVAEVLCKGKSVNLLLVEQGLAFIYPEYVRYCDKQTFTAAEVRAQATRRNVWSISGGIARPWICRKDKTKCGGAAKTEF